MSLVCHTIVSRYTPQQRDPVNTTGGIDADPWQTESSFGRTQRLHTRPAPTFVPASLEYDEYGMPKGADVLSPQFDKSHDASHDVSAWYRALTTRGSVKVEQSPAANRPPLTASTSDFPPPSPADAQRSHISDICPPPKRSWFTSCSSQATATHASKSNTLADLLSRNPPPLPSEPTFSPPVFLTIGPSNKGFTMLQRKGWQEGEGLGSARVERKRKEDFGFPRAMEAAFQERNDEQCKPVSRHSGADTKSLLDDMKHEVIDLTLSDSESESGSTQEVVNLTHSDLDLDEEDAVKLYEDTLSHRTPHGTTLLTPITTTLKADRLGIGIKPARHSRYIKAKAVTHPSAALAVHIRSGNQARVDRARHGRGNRGFARARRKEEQERIDLLAYVKS